MTLLKNFHLKNSFLQDVLMLTLRYLPPNVPAVPYAWDEPTLPPYITVTAPGGMSETYDMTIFRPGKKLYYENFFYIAFSGTFLE